MVFGEQIKKLRIENQWTQEYVCEKLNISNGALSRYETGMYEPKSLELVKDFANLFNVSTDYLLGLTSHKNPKEELEKELYNFNLTEDEYYDTINCFINDSIPGLAFIIFYGGLQETKEQKVLATILHYVLDYYPDKTKINDIGEQEYFEQQLEKNLRYAKKMLLSLDKSKIIHNYNIKQEDTPEIRAIARDIANLTPEDRELFKGFLKQMSDRANEAKR